MFFWNSQFFNDPTDVGSLIPGSSAFYKLDLNIWKFLVHILLKPSLENFDHYFATMWNECNYVVVWTFFGIALLWDWIENWPFPALRPLLSFPNLLVYWVQQVNNTLIFTSFQQKVPTLIDSSMWGQTSRNGKKDGLQTRNFNPLTEPKEILGKKRE